MQRFDIDIAIAGCGLAGLATALLLHRDGHRVTLFERFDAPRPVGSGLMIQPTALQSCNGWASPMLCSIMARGWIVYTARQGAAGE